MLNNYGCLNSADCCTAIKAAGHTYLVVLALCALGAVVALLVGAAGARYQRTTLEFIDAATQVLRTQSVAYRHSYYLRTVTCHDSPLLARRDVA